MEPEAPVTQRPPLGETERGRFERPSPSARIRHSRESGNPSPPVGAPLVGARSPSLRPLPLWRPLCNPPADWNTAGVGRSCPPLPLGEGWGEGGGWSGARRRPWSRKPRLRKGPLWGRLREGASPSARIRHSRESGNPSPPVGAPLVGARSPSLRPLPLWRPLCNPPADWNTAGVGRSCPPLPLGEGWGEGGGWSGARRRPWSRKPRLRKGPLWGRLREGASPSAGQGSANISEGGAV